MMAELINTGEKPEYHKIIDDFMALIPDEADKALSYGAHIQEYGLLENRTPEQEGKYIQLLRSSLQSCESSSRSIVGALIQRELATPIERELEISFELYSLALSLLHYEPSTPLQIPLASLMAPYFDATKKRRDSELLKLLYYAYGKKEQEGFSEEEEYNDMMHAALEDIIDKKITGERKMDWYLDLAYGFNRYPAAFLNELFSKLGEGWKEKTQEFIKIYYEWILEREINNATAQKEPSIHPTLQQCPAFTVLFDQYTKTDDYQKALRKYQAEVRKRKLAAVTVAARFSAARKNGEEQIEQMRNATLDTDALQAAIVEKPMQIVAIDDIPCIHLAPIGAQKKARVVSLKEFNNLRITSSVIVNPSEGGYMFNIPPDIQTLSIGFMSAHDTASLEFRRGIEKFLDTDREKIWDALRSRHFTSLEQTQHFLDQLGRINNFLRSGTINTHNFLAFLHRKAFDIGGSVREQLEINKKRATIEEIRTQYEASYRGIPSAETFEQIDEHINARLEYLHTCYEVGTNIHLNTDGRSTEGYESVASVRDMRGSLRLRLAQTLEQRLQLGDEFDFMVSIEHGDTLEHAREALVATDFTIPHESGHVVDAKLGNHSKTLLAKHADAKQSVCNKFPTDDQSDIAHMLNAVLEESFVDGVALRLAKHCGTSDVNDTTEAQRTARFGNALATCTSAIKLLIEQASPEQLPGYAAQLIRVITSIRMTSSKLSALSPESEVITKLKAARTEMQELFDQITQCTEDESDIRRALATHQEDIETLCRIFFLESDEVSFPAASRLQSEHHLPE